LSTIHDVARLAGVSFKTVSNVINDHPYVRESTRAKVRAAIEKLDYQPNLSARSLRSGRSGIIGLLVPELRLAYFAQLADEVIRAAERRGQIVLIEQTGGDREKELAALRSPRVQLTDGLLFSPLGLGIDDAALVDIPTPLVLLGERIFNGPVDHVTMQNVEGARAATEHLIGKGRRRIAVVGAHEGEVIGSAGLRLTGYSEALAAAGIPFDDSLIAYMGMWHRANGADATRKLLASGAQFDGLFAMNDELALGAMRVLQETGKVIPDDVAVIGFDDVDEGRYSLPSLSTVDPGRREIAETAVDVLLARIGEKSRRSPGSEPTRTPPRELLSAFRIIERESTR
jgi:DNA-binding LacI/PurR family transcriptional regulator